MDYYGLLFLYYLKGLSGKSVLRLFFNIEAGGTEQILPENTSTPTTTPILADIQYPDGLRTDQYFTYRETPTTVSNKARIKTIKGNTLNWNQQVETLIGTQEYEGVTFTNNGDGSVTMNGTSTNTSVKHPVIVANDVGADGWKASHRYYIEFNNASLQPLLVRWGTSTESAFAFARKNTEESNSTRYLINGANIGSPLGDGVGGLRFRWNANVGLTFNNAKIIPQIFDLTEMFGTEKAEEIYQMEVNEVGSGVAYFRSLFPLSYYSYNQGSLLSFNGNGIKTVGKNLLNNTATSGSVSGLTYTVNEDKSVTVNGTHTDSFTVVLGISMDVHSGEQLILAGAGDGSLSGYFLRYATRDKNGTALPIIGNMVLVDLPTDEQAITVPNGAAKLWCYIAVNGNITLNNKTFYPMVRFADVQDPSYEPYTSSTLSLPISTYFPTGMKRAGNVYDELTENKAITRVGVVDLGTLTWAYNSNGFMYSGGIIDLIAKPSASTNMANIVSTIQPTTAYAIYDGGNGIGIHINGQIRVRIDNMSTDPATFKSSMSGVYLYYELATQTETSFTTASLVTENAEIPLSNNDGVLIGKCTEQLSENPGFIDAKIKLSDSDGECYSNKIQLHVERSPQ